VFARPGQVQKVVDDHRGSVYRRAAGYGAPTNRRRLRAAAAYVASRDRRWPFSFENLCEALSLDSGRLRRALRNVPVPGTAPVAVHDVPNAGGVMALEHTPQNELGDQQRTTS
jgi:transcription initiation factor TFIIIB Brf1 subunit/transcription initiation factor TFIIB